MAQAVAQRYPDFQLDEFSRTFLYYSFERADIQREYERRSQILAEDTAKVELLLQQAIRNGETFCEISGYEYDAIARACRLMSKSDYSFDGYTSADYRFTTISQKGVGIAYD